MLRRNDSTKLPTSFCCWILRLHSVLASLRSRAHTYPCDQLRWCAQAPPAEDCGVGGRGELKAYRLRCRGSRPMELGVCGRRAKKIWVEPMLWAWERATQEGPTEGRPVRRGTQERHGTKVPPLLSHGLKCKKARIVILGGQPRLREVGCKSGGWAAALPGGFASRVASSVYSMSCDFVLRGHRVSSSVLKSTVNPKSPQFEKNSHQMVELLTDSKTKRKKYARVAARRRSTLNTRRTG